MLIFHFISFPPTFSSPLFSSSWPWPLYLTFLLSRSKCFSIRRNTRENLRIHLCFFKHLRLPSQRVSVCNRCTCWAFPSEEKMHETAHHPRRSCFNVQISIRQTGTYYLVCHSCTHLRVQTYVCILSHYLEEFWSHSQGIIILTMWHALVRAKAGPTQSPYCATF